MTEARTSEREKSIRRVRRFYEISAQREWERLEHPTQGALEFAINKAWRQKFLPELGSRILDIGGGPGRYSIWLAAQGYRVTLADLSPDLLAIAREKANEQDVQLEEVVEAHDEDEPAHDCLGCQRRKRHEAAGHQALHVPQGNAAAILEQFVQTLKARFPELPVFLKPLRCFGQRLRLDATRSPLRIAAV